MPADDGLRVIERAIAALNGRDVDAYLACCTEDIDLVTPVAEVSGAYHGHEGIRRFFRDVDDAAPDFHLDLERLERVGEHQALAFLRMHASGRASGVPVGLETANIYDLAGGKIRRIRIFPDRQQALEEVGLQE